MYTAEKFIVQPEAIDPRDGDGSRRASSTKFYDFRSPERELFMWALLFNKVELAEQLWKMCVDPIGALNLLIFC